MKIRATASIGFPTAKRSGVFEIYDEDIEGMNDEEREEYISTQVWEWATQFLDIGWKEID